MISTPNNPMQDVVELRQELGKWQRQMQKRPSFLNKAAKRMQTKINSYIPEKAHKVITAIIKKMVQVVLFGARHTTAAPVQDTSLAVRETLVIEKIKQYRKTAAVEGGITGAGGFLMGLADFPLLLGIKIKLLFDIAHLYGYSTDEYKERIFLLHIFQLAFSSQEHRRDVYLKMENWDTQYPNINNEPDAFNWRAFQQEYRDYIDLAKLAQLIPIIGAPVGFVVNYQLVKKLGRTAMYAYRMRWLENNPGTNHLLK
jgi:hypothetical protein